jgi:hypothetical protein
MIKCETALKKAIVSAEIKQFNNIWQPVKIAIHKGEMLIIHEHGYFTLIPENPVTKNNLINELTVENINYPVFRRVRMI